MKELFIKLKNMDNNNTLEVRRMTNQIFIENKEIIFIRIPAVIMVQ